MTRLLIENLISGVATGTYVKSIGSQFGSIWGWDGLMVAEATPEQYTAFGAKFNVKLCHGQDVVWLGREWSSILAYTAGRLMQVTIYTDADDAIHAEVCARLSSILGERYELESDEFEWSGRGGIATLTRESDYLHLSIGKYTQSVGTIGRILEYLRGLFQ